MKINAVQNHSGQAYQAIAQKQLLDDAIERYYLDFEILLRVLKEEFSLNQKISFPVMHTCDDDIEKNCFRERFPEIYCAEPCVMTTIK